MLAWTPTFPWNGRGSTRVFVVELVPHFRPFDTLNVVVQLFNLGWDVAQVHIVRVRFDHAPIGRRWNVLRRIKFGRLSSIPVW